MIEPESAKNAPFEAADIPHALTQLARLADGVKAEFDLIAGRMSWLVISESFIFSAFGTAASSYRPDHPCAGALLYMIWVMPVLGMCLAVCVQVALIAAHRAIRILKNQRERMIARLPVPLHIDLISTNSREQWMGNLPTHVIPPLLFLIWAVAFVTALTRNLAGG